MIGKLSRRKKRGEKGDLEKNPIFK
jgi:hypothetical protein